MKFFRAGEGKLEGDGGKWGFFPFLFCWKRGCGSLGGRNSDGEVLVGDSIHLATMFIPWPELARPVSVCVRV